MGFSNSQPGIGQTMPGGVPVDQGVFLPTYLGDALDPDLGQTYTAQSGAYIRVGDVVFISIDIEVLSRGSLQPAEQVRLGNLPFIVTTDIASQAYSGFGEQMTAFSNQSLVGRFLPGTTVMELNRWSSAAGTTIMDVSSFGLNGHVQFSGAYFI